MRTLCVLGGDEVTFIDAAACTSIHEACGIGVMQLSKKASQQIDLTLGATNSHHIGRFFSQR